MRQYTQQTGCLLHNDECKLYVSNDNGIIYEVSVDDINISKDMIKTDNFKILRKHNATVFDQWRHAIQALQTVECTVYAV